MDWQREESCTVMNLSEVMSESLNLSKIRLAPL
jgi:hypothetical protein